MLNIPHFISQIPSHLYSAFHKVIVKGAKAKQWAVDHFNQSALWQQYGKPFYSRNIQPLRLTDYLILGAGLALAMLVNVVAIRFLTIAGFPIGLGLGALIFMGACTLIRHRTRQYFNAIAWTHVDQIRRTIPTITSTNQQFGLISQYQAQLQQPEFKHLDADLKQLDEELRQFRKVVLAPSYPDQQKIVVAHLDFLKPLVQAHAQDELIIKELEIEVNKVGQKDQDLAALENQKQQLHQLQTGAAQEHIDELKEQIASLVKAAEGPLLADSRRILLEYLQGLQQKLASHREIEELASDKSVEELEDTDHKIDEIDDQEILDKHDDEVTDELAIQEQEKEQEELDSLSPTENSI